MVGRGLPNSQVDNLKSVPHECNFTFVSKEEGLETPIENAWLSVVLPEELKRWVRVEAAQRNMSASAYVRDLVERERGVGAHSRRTKPEIKRPTGSR
jgi:hypothetical protein